MKYPQLVSMPSAVQDWLDEQLEARGIDAVVYTRYILSLLQRDTLDLPDDLLTLSSSRNKKCGIEKLVDELCTKLKEIQNEGENIVNEPVINCQPPNQSPQDQAHKYYAAFPPLNSKSSETNNSIITLIPDHSSVWSGKRILSNSFCKKIEGENFNILAEHSKNKEAAQSNMKCRSELLDIGRNEKELGYGFAWNMASERNELFTEFSPVGFSSSDSSDLLRVFKYNKQNLEKENMKPGVCRRLYERQSEDDEVNLESLEDALEEDRIHNADDPEQSPKQVLDDSNLAQLIAKFDHSIEAIWNPEDAPHSPEGDKEVVPVDFQQLLASPSEQLLTVELCSLNNKPHSENNSFIQCGTNIISSIWSDHPSKDNSVEHEDYRMDYALGDQTSVTDKFEQTAGKELGSTSGEKLSAEKFRISRFDDGKLKLESSDVSRSGEKGECKITFANSGKGNTFTNANTEEKSKITWNKLENFPSFFTSVSCGSINYSMENLSRSFCSRKWSDVDHAHTNIFSGNHFHPQKPAHRLKTLIDGIENYSFNTLNHNSEDSSFTEVIPKSVSELCVLPGNDAVPNSSQDVDSVNNENKKQLDGEAEKEEEDLLTSNRTHFRPIRQESSESHNTTGCYADGTTFVIPNNLEEVSFKRSESGALYLENDVGAETPKKYMEYKEKEPYGGRHKCGDHSPASAIYFSQDGNFIPKFRVRQTEKCCQTEEAEDIFTSDEEIDPKRSRQDEMGESNINDFYFPGDDQFAEKIINCLEDDLNKYAEPCLTCCHHDKYGTAITFASCTNHKTKSGNNDHCVTSCGNPEIEIQTWSSAMKPCCNCNNNNNLLSWKTGWLKSSNPGLPNEKIGWETSDSEKANLPQSWYDIWRGSPGPRPVLCANCCGSPAHAGVDSGRSLQYFRLRKELSEDGEQLLSDLSYLQHLYLGSDWLDDQGEHDEVLPPQKLQCLSPDGEPSHELQLYDDESSYTRSLPVHLVEYHSVKEELGDSEAKSVDNFIISSSTVAKKLLLTTGPEAECKFNERPFDARTSQKDRKRRHSASQRACSFFLEGSCERPAVPGQFWADSSCLKGGACPFFHGCVRAFRPVTL